MSNDASDASDSTTLANRWAIVTGSSSGIGRAIALELASAGANVVVHGCQPRAAVEEIVATIRAQGRESHALPCDLSLAAERTEFAARAWEIAPVDVWVNNAGADVLTGAAADWTFEKKLATLWAVDVEGTIQLSRDVGARMKRRGRGAIINIGWDQAASGMGGDSGELFAATKGAIMAFTLSLAKSLAPEVRVNCVAPGWIKTEWGAGASAYWQQRATEESLLGRWGTPADVAGTVGYLVSSKASFITGQIVHVNGGIKGVGSERAGSA